MSEAVRNTTRRAIRSAMPGAIRIAMTRASHAAMIAVSILGRTVHRGAMAAGMVALLLISAKSRAEPVAVKVVDVAGGAVYLSPGRAAGIAPGTKIRLRGVELVVVEVTEKTAMARLEGARANVGDAGTADVTPGAAPATRTLPRPHPPEAFNGQWNDPVLPATHQTPKTVPLGAGRAPGNVHVTVAGHAFAATDHDRTTTNAEGRVIASFDVMTERPLMADVDVAGRWFSDGANRGVRTPVLIRTAQLAYGEPSDPRFAVGRLRFAATSVGMLDGGRASARAGNVELAAFGGLAPDPVSGKPDTGASRFGAEVIYDAPDAAHQPRVAIAAHGSTCGGRLDERRLSIAVSGIAWGTGYGPAARDVSSTTAGAASSTASGGSSAASGGSSAASGGSSAASGGSSAASGGVSRNASGVAAERSGVLWLDGWAELDGFGADNPWGASAVELTGAGATAEWRRRGTHAALDVTFLRPERSLRLAAVLPPEWLCTLTPVAGDPSVERCESGWWASATASVGTRTPRWAVDAVATLGDSHGQYRGFDRSGFVRGELRAGPARLDVAVSGGQASFVSWTALELGAAFAPARAVDVAVAYRPELRDYAASTEAQLVHHVIADARVALSGALDVAVSAIVTLGRADPLAGDRDALAVLAMFAWRPLP